MIAVENLTVRAGAFALEGVTFALGAGAYGVLMGKTGAGKTTLLEGLCGLKPIEIGTIRLLGRDVTRLGPADRGIGYVPQDRALFPTMTVRDHLAFALVVRRWPPPLVEARVAALADLLGLERLLDRKPHGLSGGEASRVALGRALAGHPRVLLLDEPLSALDDQTREEMHALLKRVQQASGVTTLHVTHSGEEARRLADHVLLLENGAVRPVGRREAAVAAGELASADSLSQGAQRLEPLPRLAEGAP
jgi:ABC-type sugar transport system ATPase subunit